MKVALSQIDCLAGDVQANAGKLCDEVRRAARQGCRVVIFPETADTGYDPALIPAAATSWHEGAVPALRATAVETGIFIVAGLCQRDGDKLYNALAVISPDGKIIGSYRKTHLITPPPFNEDRCFTPGSDLLLVQIDGWRWGFTICYDLRFPELYRALALNGAQVLVNVAAFPASRTMNWDVLTRARAIENQAYLLAANRVGTDGPFHFGGLSRVVTPDGTLAAAASDETPELLVARIDAQQVSAMRSQIPVFKARRADLYTDLIKPAPFERKDPERA